MIDIIGWIGAVCFALCAVPQMVTTIRLGNAEGISGLFLLLWTSGEVAMIIYVLGSSADPILLFNYLFNLICLSVIIKYKVRPR